MNVKWSAKDRQFIRANAHKMKDRELAAELSSASGRDVSTGAVRKARQRLGIAKKGGRGICELK